MTDAQPEAPRLFEIGEVVAGAYEIKGILGEGGMGRVYVAHDVALNRRVALKASWPHVDKALLRKEAQALASVRHPGMVDVYASGVWKDIPFFVMEHVYGVNLDTLLQRRKGSPLSVAEVIDLLVPMADALAALHAAGISHRDVKPANAMLTPSGRVVLMDFGLFAADSDPNAPLSGTPEYMAPEGLQGEVRPRQAFLLDTYALGITAYELLAGAPPFEAATPLGTLTMHIQEPVPDVRERRADVGVKLGALLCEMLAKDPLERPPSMESIAWRLRAIKDTALAPVGPEKFTIVICDDDAAIAKLLALYAQRTLPDAAITRVNDAESALAMVQEKQPHMMLLDLHMPKMNGIELCMILKGMRLANPLTIVAVSAGARDADVEVLRSLGITRFVPKGADLGSKINPFLREIHDGWKKSVTRERQSHGLLAMTTESSIAPPNARRAPSSRRIAAVSKRALDFLLDVVGDAVIITDGRGEPRAWNERAERVLGMGLTRVEGEPWTAQAGVLDPHTGLTLPQAERPIPRALLGEMVDEQEIAVTRGDGSEMTVLSVTARPIASESGLIEGVVAVFRVKAKIDAKDP